jgi:hypothetical protein
VFILTKMGWAVWAIFTQAPPVTLVTSGLLKKIRLKKI